MEVETPGLRRIWVWVCCRSENHIIIYKYHNSTLGIPPLLKMKIGYRRIPEACSFTCRAVAQKLKTQNQKEDQISIRTTPDNADSEVFSDSRRFFHDFFLEKVILYGEVVIKSRYLETKPLKFSPPKSLCGTVGSPWVSLATLFGFWETLIKFSESMILYGENLRLIYC